jgi:hypothetical protein
MVREPHHEREDRLFVDGSVGFRSSFDRLRMSGTIATSRDSAA